MERRNVRLVLAYDGTEFLGWERQAEGRTVQAVVEAALGELHGHPVGVVAAGRTDSGVHAAGQVISFSSDSPVPDDRFHHALNGLLPHDVRALRGGRVGDEFNARYSARARVYKYYLRAEEVECPTTRRYCWSLRKPPDLRRLISLSAAVVGTHDFTTFAASGDSSASKVRDVYSSVFYREGDALVFKIAGNAFLYRMVRSLVGTFVELETRGEGPEKLKELLARRDRDAAGPTAPARGLFLEKVLYDDETPA